MEVRVESPMGVAEILAVTEVGGNFRGNCGSFLCLPLRTNLLTSQLGLLHVVNRQDFITTDKYQKKTGVCGN